jgi:hypothetical protein
MRFQPTSLAGSTHMDTLPSYIYSLGLDVFLPLSVNIWRLDLVPVIRSRLCFLNSGLLVIDGRNCGDGKGIRLRH